MSRLFEGRASPERFVPTRAGGCWSPTREVIADPSLQSRRSSLLPSPLALAQVSGSSSSGRQDWDSQPSAPYSSAREPLVGNLPGMTGVFIRDYRPVIRNDRRRRARAYPDGAGGHARHRRAPAGPLLQHNANTLCPTCAGAVLSRRPLLRPVKHRAE